MSSQRFPIPCHRLINHTEQTSNWKLAGGSWRHTDLSRGSMSVVEWVGWGWGWEGWSDRVFASQLRVCVIEGRLWGRRWSGSRTLLVSLHLSLLIMLCNCVNNYYRVHLWYVLIFKFPILFKYNTSRTIKTMLNNNRMKILGLHCSTTLEYVI